MIHHFRDCHDQGTQLRCRFNDPMITMTYGCTLGTSMVAFVPSYTCPNAGTVRENDTCHRRVALSPTKWLTCTGTMFVPALLTEVNAGLSNILPVETCLLYRSLSMLEQCGLVSLNAICIQL